MLGLPLGALALAYAPWVLTIIGGFYLGLRLVRAFERRAAARAEIARLDERILRLEESLSLNGERLDRIADAQEFTTRLLAERK